jgi:hypothetical protein
MRAMGLSANQCFQRTESREDPIYQKFIGNGPVCDFSDVLMFVEKLARIDDIRIRFNGECYLALSVFGHMVDIEQDDLDSIGASSVKCDNYSGKMFGMLHQMHTLICTGKAAKYAALLFLIERAFLSVADLDDEYRLDMDVLSRTNPIIINNPRYALMAIELVQGK